MTQSHPITIGSIEMFRQLYDRHPQLGSKANIENFIAECQKMEDFFIQIGDKQKCLPLYLWMMERLQAFEVPQDTPGAQIALLQCLYTLTLSKILQIKAGQESRLIIDIQGFLDCVSENINALDKLDHTVLVRIYENEYVEEIGSQIAEADHMLKKLSDAIRTADGEIVAQIKKLVAEIEMLQKNQVAKGEELAAKRQELQEAISKRTLFGGLTIAAQCIGCCFPPAGPIVAGVVSAGLSIATSSDTASALGAQVLTAYTEGISEVLDKDKGVPLSNVHLTALSRVRTLTLMNAVINVSGPTRTEEEQIKDMETAINSLNEQFKQLEKFKETIQANFQTSLHQIVDGAVEMQKALKGKSKMSLDFSRLAIKRAFDTIKGQVKAVTKPFAAEEGFHSIIQQLEDIIETSAKIYEHIQKYEEKQRLAHYLARLAAPQAQSHDIELYKQKVQRNVVLEQYCRAVAAARQWAFPYASVFLEDFTNLKPFAESATVDDFMVQVKQQLKLLKSKVNGHHTQIHTAIDTFLWTGKFASGEPNGPFYIWNYAEHGQEIRDLLRGESVTFFADVNRTSHRASAVKFTHLELQITSKMPLFRKSLSAALKGVAVEMHHSGLSYYRHGDKIYQMTNDKGFSLKYRFKEQGETPDDCNAVFSKMQNGNFMLSPYTQWTIKLDVPSSFIEKFMEKLPGVEIHLIGRGQYIHAGKAKGKNWDLGQYANNVFLF